MVVPDVTAWGSYYLWDKLGWSVQRAGIISVSGIGGMLTGIFTEMIMSEAFNFDPEPALSSSIIMAGSLAGKILGAKVSSNMEPDPKAEESLLSQLAISPVFGPKGTGVTMCFRY